MLIGALEVRMVLDFEGFSPIFNPWSWEKLRVAEHSYSYGQSSNKVSFIHFSQHPS